jgi:protein SCO1
MRNSRIVVFAVLLAVFSCREQGLPYYHTAEFTPLWTGEDLFSSDTLHRIAPFTFTDQNGASVSNATVQGKVYVANFIFTACPGICPKMTNNLNAVQKAFLRNPDVMILSHSVMPWADSVSRLKEFSELHQLDDSQWKLLTGKQSDIYDLARNSYFAEEVAGFARDSTDFIHTEHCLLIDRDGHIRGLYNGTLPLEIGRLIDDIKLLLD